MSSGKKITIDQVHIPSDYGSVLPRSFDYFEIKEAEGKGLGAFATRPIKAFTTVFPEQSIMSFNKDRSQVSENNLIAAYKNLSSQDKHIFDNMRNCHGICGCKSGLFFANAFGLPGGVGCFPIRSRLNHSCQANCMIDTHEKYYEKRITVLKDLEPGDELTFHYYLNTQFMTYEQRRADFRDVPSASLGPHRGILPDMVMASYMLLFCHLAEAEGVIVGSLLGTSFVKLIHCVMFRSAMKRVRQLPESILTNVQTWWKKAHSNGSGGSVLDYFDNMLWDTVGLFMSCVRDDGKIDSKNFDCPLRDVTEDNSWSEVMVALGIQSKQSIRYTPYFA
ncbi:hypothetical protein M409DRAFT_25401 [Zasmidium cellare ATCC 36951]|uniref:SET domain-containing protein n=1 Tax=Zasmidium cellare ATCC 36951 TaxID=1080233 RepID=A0A6A6CDR0_ZASCE|nr:uncharacterized protein M409DRAFT_25401 [Zasmidium cellare ATCC 36951]KAF2164052.1 hypothetical protein M409DRAFT_25401 [Zasmidium cellare ATCC 36951]